MKKTIAIALVLVMLAALLAGCSGGKDKYAAAGEYICTSMTTVGLTMDPTMLGMEITLTLNDDGTGVLHYVDDEAGRQLLWSQDGNTLTLTIEGDSAEASATDDSVTLKIVDDAGEVEFIFTKR